MKRILLFFSIILTSYCFTSAFGQVSKFQALYLLNFSKNLDWSSDNIVIGVVGNTKTIIELEGLTDKYPNISLKKIAASESVSDCQMVFLPSSQSKNFSAIQNKIGNLPIVLVCEDEELTKQGAEIGFYLEGNRLKFTINQTALNESTVTANEKLLSVARIVN